MSATRGGAVAAAAAILMGTAGPAAAQQAARGKPRDGAAGNEISFTVKEVDPAAGTVTFQAKVPPGAALRTSQGQTVPLDRLHPGDEVRAQLDPAMGHVTVLEVRPGGTLSGAGSSGATGAGTGTSSAAEDTGAAGDGAAAGGGAHDDPTGSRAGSEPPRPPAPVPAPHYPPAHDAEEARPPPATPPR